MEEQRKWYALYVKPRWEKKVNARAEAIGIECYCPLNKVTKKWSDRIKLVEEPLFKSYVFVHITEKEKSDVRYVAGVVNFVYWLGKPAVINDQDIERIKRFLSDYTDVHAESLDLAADTKVVITSGALMDQEATVIRDGKKRVEVKIESLGYNLIAFVGKDNIRVIK